MKDNSFVRFLRLCLAALVLCIPAQAFAIELSDVPSVPMPEFMDQKAFEEQTTFYQDTPLNDPYLAYEIRLPKTWGRGETYALEKENKDGGVSLDILGNVARYDGPPQIDARSSFTIEALQLDYEITARSWFTNFVLSNGYTVHGMDEISDRELNALYVYVENANSYIVRMAARINGPRIIVARYFVPQVSYDEEKVMQAQAMSSFRLTNTTGKQIETRYTYSFLDQSYFDYPVSWDIKERDIMSIERMKTEVYNLSESEELNGRIRVLVVSRLLDTTLGEEIERFMNSFSVKNYTLEGLIDRHDFVHHPDMDFVKTEAYKLDPQLPTMMKYELWASVLQNDDYYYIVTMLTPARNAEYFIWTKNVEAFRIVLSSIRRYQ